jgi:mono/diheme cytochrome c family protein
MRLRAFLLPALIALPAGSVASGGWAVVTVENPPEHLVVGVPYTLEYSVRQHGQTLLDGLNGVVEATSKSKTLRVDGREGTAKGKYVATVVLPSEGAWTIIVHSGFGASKTTMKPITASAAGAPVVAMSAAERGEHLFSAKGCVTCHVDMKVIPVDVRSGKYDEKFVKELLADPKSMPKRHNAGVEMPNLNLKSAEISALAAYLAGPNSAGTR